MRKLVIIIVLSLITAGTISPIVNRIDWVPPNKAILKAGFLENIPYFQKAEQFVEQLLSNTFMQDRPELADQVAPYIVVLLLLTIVLIIISFIEAIKKIVKIILICLWVLLVLYIVLQLI